MLLIQETIKVAQDAGANLAQQEVVGRKRIETQWGGIQYDAIMACPAVGGTPFGNLQTVTTPIALKVGDEVHVDQESGAMVMVLREGVQVWPNDATLTPALSQQERETKRGKA